MKRFETQFNTEAKKLSLTASEKALLEERLTAYMEYHPMAVPDEKVVKKQILKVSEPFLWLSIPKRVISVSFSVSAIFLLIVVPAMAEQAVPGDVLYGVKVRINEEVRGSLNISAEQKANWETLRVERRLNEARQLAKAGKLTPEMEARVAATVVKQKEIAKEQIAVLNAEDSETATLASATLASVLEVQGTLLEADLGASDTNELTKVIEDSRVDIEDGLESEIVSKEKLTAMLEIGTTRAHESLLSLEGDIGTEQYEQILRRITDIESAIHTSGEGEESQGKMYSAWQDLQKLISYISGLNHPSEVAVETLVPIKLTIEERLKEVAIQYHTLEPEYQKLVALDSEGIEADIFEKLQYSLPNLSDLLEVAKEPNADTLEMAEASLKEARAIIESLVTMLDINPDKIELPIDNGLGTSTATTTDEIIEESNTDQSTSTEILPTIQ